MDLSKALFVSIVLLGIASCALAHKKKSRSSRHHDDEHRCIDTAVLMSPCGTDKVCAWNKCTCTSSGGPGCHLVCTNNPYTLCHGLAEEDQCYDDSGDNYCLLTPVHEKLVCIITPHRD